jgi:hypothetical protein
MNTNVKRWRVTLELEVVTPLTIDEARMRVVMQALLDRNGTGSGRFGSWEVTAHRVVRILSGWRLWLP